MTTRTAPRGNLRVADLKQRKPDVRQLINVKLPTHIADAITEIASHTAASKTDVTITLLNLGLGMMKRRRGK